MRAFINNDGQWYKGEQAKDKSHAERPVVTTEFLAALSDEPQDLVDVDAKVQHILNAGGAEAYTKQQEELKVEKLKATKGANDGISE